MLTSKPRLPVRQIIFPGLLPSPLKKLYYRLRGYRIGRNVSLGFGCVVSGTDVELGDGVQIGFLTVVRGKKIHFGPHVQIGTMTFLDTPIIEIGEGTKINEQVFVGGLQFPESSLIVGRNCQIMQMSFINPTRSIRIGDDTGIGGDCLLFGHTSWLSRFEGYPVDFDSIEIGNSVSIAWRVFVLPGARIGDGAVIGANSLVRGVIPERCLAVGFPARVVSKHPEFPRSLNAAEKVTILREIVDEMIAFFRGFDLECEPIEHGWRVRRRAARKPWPIIIDARAEGDAAPSPPIRGAAVYLSLGHISDDRRRDLERQDTVWIDIERKERSDRNTTMGEEVIQYLRRHGVRFLRVRAVASAHRGSQP